MRLLAHEHVDTEIIVDLEASQVIPLAGQACQRTRVGLQKALNQRTPFVS